MRFFPTIFWLCLVITIDSLTGRAQDLIPLGTWRSHIAYQHASHILMAGTRVYCITDNGIFYFDKSDNSLGTLSKVNGLSDVVITAAGYGDDGTLVLGYDNGNLDIIRGNEIGNFTGIRDTPLNSPKGINDITIYGIYAYLATSYGIVVFDLDKENIFESWRDLGADAETIPVNSIAVCNDTVYAATGTGIMTGSLNPDVNLIDYNNWKRFDASSGIMQGPASAVVVFNNEVIAAIDKRYLYALRGNNWYLIRDFNTDLIRSVSSSDKFLGVVSDSGAKRMDGKYDFTNISDALIRDPRYCISDKNGKLFIADALNGMVTNVSGDFRSIYPDGPFIENAASVSYENDKIVILPPGMRNAAMPLRNNAGFSVFERGRWDNYNNSGAKGQHAMPDVLDLVSVDYNSQTDKMIFASFGYGLVEWNGGKDFSIVDENTQGSLLVNFNPPERNTFVSSVTFDESGDLYMINNNVPRPLVIKSASGEWSSYQLPDPYARNGIQLLKIPGGAVWIRINPELDDGIVVYDGSSGESRNLTDAKNNGDLPGNSVNDMALDQDGMVWVATNRGVAYFPAPENVLTAQDINAVVPVFDNRYLLRGEIITCIAVDGGNNKWVGTEKGAWLFNHDGSKLLINFNSANSPLFSDEIVDIGINDRTGEVFFSTGKGLLSWRGTATAAEDGFNDFRIFPNPVPPGFSGLVGISGLPAGAVVKITNVNGSLVYETVSMGGTATWNTFDRSGSKVATGVYMVFSATPDGNETLVGKLAVIR